MSKKIRWLKPITGGGPPREAGMVEENDDDLCTIWVEKGLAEYVGLKTKTDAEEKAEEYQARCRPVAGPEHKAVEEPQRHRAVTSPKKIAAK